MPRSILSSRVPTPSGRGNPSTGVEPTERLSYGLPQEVRPDHYADNDLPPYQLGEGNCEQPSNEPDCSRESTRRTAALVMFRHMSTSDFSNDSRRQFIAGSASCSAPQHRHFNTVSSSTTRRHGIALADRFEQILCLDRDAPGVRRLPDHHLSWPAG